MEGGQKQYDLVSCIDFVRFADYGGGERGASAVLALCGNIGVLALTVLLLASGKPPL